MSDLTGKFGGFEDQITANHAEIMEALNTIAFALGAPPTIPSTSLADVVAAIETTNGLLTDIFNTVDSINNNASLNAQRLLTLLLQTACPCDDTVPLLPPPLDTLPTDLEDEAKCQRIQYFLDLFSSWVILCTVYLNDNGSISSFQVNNLLSGVMLSVGISSSELNAIPTSIRDSLTTALNTNGTPDAINASIFDVITNGTVIADMRQALYAQDNAADGSNEAKNAIDMTGGPYANIISAMFYSGWPNVMYGTEPEVDASGYDGTICAPPDEDGCITINSSVVGFATDGNGSAIVWPSPFESIDHTPTGYTATAAVWCLTDLNGYTITPTVTINFYHHWNFGAVGILAGTTYLVSATTDRAAIHIYPSTESFSIELCAPE